jgi:leader peptidase (prepilin peptidase)/N-methyltransferase
MVSMSSVIELLATCPALFVGIAGLLGLIVGSFLNVVIYRLPVMLERQWREQCADLGAVDAGATTVPALSVARFNLIVPRSACPACKAPIGAAHNVPLLSYLLLRGRCANCGAAISARYPLVEALTGILTAAVAWKFGFGWSALAGMVLTWFLIALTFIDVDHQLLPDSLTLPLLWLGLCASLWLPLSAAAAVPVDVRSSLIGAVAGYVSLWSVYHLFRLFTGKDGMGYGDFKLFAALGAWLGWQMLLPIILFASAAGAVTGIAMLTMRKQQRSTPIAFGPFLAAAGWLMLLFGQQLVAGYLHP